MGISPKNSYINSQRKDNRGIPPLSQNGSLYADPNQNAEILNNFFSSVFSDKKSIVPSVEESPIPDIAPITIDMDGIKKTVRLSQNYWPRQYPHITAKVT